MSNKDSFTLNCPTPLAADAAISLAHGSGGALTHQLLEQLILPAFHNPMLDARHDGAVLEFDGIRLAFSTDSYVVQPLFFPGGNIGDLAINGTVSDLAMCGATPRYLSAGLILEEGFPMEQLERIISSMQVAAKQADVELVTGDTKVVEKGCGDGVFINTSGIGIIEGNTSISPARIEKGDLIILSGDLGRHGIAVMAAREGLDFGVTIASDTAPLSLPVLSLLAAGIDLHCLRDLTRGGLATALVEVAGTAQADFTIEERAIPVSEPVRGACEVLGLDPLYVANEGRFIAWVKAAEAEQVLEILHGHPLGAGACIIGQVTEGRGTVTMETHIGGKRAIDMLSGEQLPRIC